MSSVARERLKAGVVLFWVRLQNGANSYRGASVLPCSDVMYVRTRHAHTDGKVRWGEAGWWAEEPWRMKAAFSMTAEIDWACSQPDKAGRGGRVILILSLLLARLLRDFYVIRSTLSEHGILPTGRAIFNTS